MIEGYSLKRKEQELSDLINKLRKNKIAEDWFLFQLKSAALYNPGKSFPETFERILNETIKLWDLE